MRADGVGGPPRQLVSGRPSIWWARVGLLALGALGLNLVLLVGALLLGSGAEDASTAVHVTLVALVVTGATCVACLATGIVQDVREMRAGYTTAFGWHQGYDQVDAVTGDIVRRAGEPPITSRELESRRSASRPSSD